MKQVFLNLLDNAIKHAFSKVKVEVLLKVSEGKLIISIQNDGKQLSESELVEIFERYVTKTGKGTGIGLAISRELVRLHGGRLEARNVDGGVSFDITLSVYHKVNGSSPEH